MTRVHQILVSASAGDAITNAALDLRAGLRRHGRSEIFAAFIDPALAGEAHVLTEFPRLGAGADLLVMHASIGEPVLTAFLAQRREAMALVYHNISPAEAFTPYAPGFARLLEQGRRELAQLAGRVTMAVADSEYNAAELVSLGYDPVTVVPLAVDPTALLATEPDPKLSAELAGLDGPRLLYVGQLLPHKRVDWLLMAYHALVTHLRPQVHLLLVGADRLPGYGSALGQMVHELNLWRARLMGPVSQAALVTCYRQADAFVTASEHEGFCVPVLEAMAFGLPVVARSFAALPETLGGGGLLLGREDGPLAGAEALAAVLGDEGVRADLVARGGRRVAALDPDGARAQMVALVLAAGAGAGAGGGAGRAGGAPGGLRSRPRS